MQSKDAFRMATGDYRPAIEERQWQRVLRELGSFFRFIRKERTFVSGRVT